MKKGFTLVEMLVVVSIIGLLTTIVTINVISAHVKSRDSRRKADVETIVLAAHMFYADNKTFDFSKATPPCNCGESGKSDGWFGYEDGSQYPASIAKYLFTAGYLSAIPVDPKYKAGTEGTAEYRDYMYYHNVNFPGVYARLEGDPTDIDKKNLFTYAPSIFGANGVCTSNGGPCSTSYHPNYISPLK